MIRFSHVNKKFTKRQVEKGQKIEVLRDFSMEVPGGSVLGVYGPNGSGKSTICKLIAGTLVPDGGKIETEGTIVPFLELGVAFHDELSGMENILLNGVLLDIRLSHLLKVSNEIIEYAELQGFEETPLKYYSSGMKARLAYSISRYADGSIYIFDEILAVGDADFQEKCWGNFDRFVELGKTIVIASHDLDLLEKHCSHLLNFNLQDDPEVKVM